MRLQLDNLLSVKFPFLALVLVASMMFSCAPEPPDTVELRVSELLNKMTLEEKIGQMTQVHISVVANEAQTADEYQKLDAQKLRKAIVDYHVGSILSVIQSAYTLKNWHEIISQIQDVATKETRLGIPIIYGIDAIHGANFTKGATIFPHNIGMAATWNPELLKKSAEITAYEVRASGIPWNFNPVLGVGRQPLWPRLFETFGEDPYLASIMGAAYVKGLEGEENDIAREDKVASCIKHYIGYSVPLTGKDRTPAWIPERYLREYLLPSFKAAIDNGAHTLMVNSSEINGIPIHASYYYLTELLRDELGFRGFVVSDWADIINLHTREKVAESAKEAVRMAVMAGVDMSMVPLDFSFYEYLLELIKEGSVPVARINEAVRRILTVKFELGLFENPYPNKKRFKKFASKEFDDIALRAAHESITLLKNEDNILPITKYKRILVTGPTATKLSTLNGGWTITWQGNDDKLYPAEKPNILQALEKKFGPENIIYREGSEIQKEVNITEVVTVAKTVDVVVACIGEEAYCETMGNINDLTLPEAQLHLVEELQKTGIPVVLVLTEGRPRIINRIIDNSKGVIMAYLPGMNGGRAIADILTGDINPSGKLPISYPRFPNDFTLYDHKNSENVSEFTAYNPQFPFGYGLSYTTFKYENLNISQDTLQLGESLTVQVTVSNDGELAGMEVVQLYLSDLVSSVTPANKRLKRFHKVSLKSGASRQVDFVLSQDDLSFIGLNNQSTVEQGTFRVSVGNLDRTFFLTLGR